MLFANKLTDPGGIKKLAVYPRIVNVETQDGRFLDYVLVGSGIDKEIADDLRSHWRNQNSGSEKSI